MYRYTFGGSVADGSIDSPEMDKGFSHAQFYIEFHDSGGNVVTPTAGTVLVELSVDGDVWERMPHGRFPADQAVTGTRLHPAARGTAQYCRVTLTGVTGADTYASMIARW